MKNNEKDNVEKEEKVSTELNAYIETNQRLKREPGQISGTEKLRRIVFTVILALFVMGSVLSLLFGIQLAIKGDV